MLKFLQGKTETETRVRTGFSGALIFIGLLYAGSIGSFFLTALLVVFMLFECARMRFMLPDRKEKTFGLVSMGWLLVLTGAVIPQSFFGIWMGFFLLSFIYFLATADRHPLQLREHFNEFVFAVFSLIYVVGGMSFLLLLRSREKGLALCLFLFSIVWLGDTAAYFVGKKYGKRKLYPLISPGKSIEGGLASVGSSLVVSLIFKSLFVPQMSWMGCILIPICVNIAAQLGDLSESFLKRAEGVKDSGHWLPGHGGFLDRFDAVLFALPVMYWGVQVFF